MKHDNCCAVNCPERLGRKTEGNENQRKNQDHPNDSNNAIIMFGHTI